MFRRFNFALVNLISKKIAVKKYVSRVKNFYFCWRFVHKYFLEWLESCEKISLLRDKKIMVFSIVNNVKDIVLDCFLFENIKQFLVKKVISLFFFWYLWHHIILIKLVKFYYEFLKVFFVKLYSYNHKSIESVINKVGVGIT